MQVNYPAVVVAAVVNMAIGAFWYSPRLFGKAWLDLMGWKPEEVEARKEGVSRAYALTFVASLVMAYVLARVVGFAQAQTVVDGGWIGLLLWIGFIATTTYANYLFEGRPLRLFRINTGYHLVALIVMGALLAVWR